MCWGRCDWSEIMYNVCILSSSKRNIYHVEVALEDVDGKGSLANRPLLLPHPEKLAPSSPSLSLTTSSVPPSIFNFLLYF